MMESDPLRRSNRQYRESGAYENCGHAAVANMAEDKQENQVIHAKYML